MLLGSSPETPYDLRFRLFNVPVRVHPLFWLVMVMVSGQSESLMRAGVFVLCAFLSITVHEFGHGLMGRLMGYEPRAIVLYAMGGYCEFIHGNQTPWRRLLILMAGPGAGFVLAGLIFLALLTGMMPNGQFGSSEPFQLAINYLLYINIVWGILNLFPIWPLDGGQISGVLLGMLSPYSGQRWSHILSLLVAGGIAAFAASRNEFFIALWFGYFGFINYQILQSYHQSYSSPYS